MTDQNDALLLKLKWVNYNDHMWMSPTGARGLWPDRPRPYSNLQDAVDCVPEGWSVGMLWEAVSPKDRPWWGATLRRDDPYKVVKALEADTPAEALAEAISKVVTRKENSHD